MSFSVLLCSSLFVAGVSNVVMNVGSQGISALIRGVFSGVSRMWSTEKETCDSNRALALELAQKLSSGDYKLYEIGSRKTHFYVLETRVTTNDEEVERPASPVFL